VSTTWKKPRVFISYTWRPDENMARAFQLAEDLRAHGIDARLDQYFLHSHHGFSPPAPQLNDLRDPWITWAEAEITAADSVILLCTEQYAASDPDRASIGGEWHRWHKLPYEQKLRTKPPAYVWWDWHNMLKEWEGQSANSAKYIPAGFGPYSTNSRFIPGFLGNAAYCNLDSKSDFDGLLRRIRSEHRKRNPREGIFISYAHKDESFWIDGLLHRLRPLEASGVNVWTDREIEPGDRYHEEIQGALSAAKIAVLLVSPAYLESEYISSHELPNFLQSAASDGLRIFWIPVERSEYKKTEIEKYHAAHAPDRPLSELEAPERESALDAIASALTRALRM